MFSLYRFVVDHRVAVVAWLVWCADVLNSWVTAGQPLNAHTFVLALVTGLATKRPGDASPKQVEKKLAVARKDAARGARISSEPPPRLTWNDDLPPVLDLPDEATPVERPRGGQQ